MVILALKLKIYLLRLFSYESVMHFLCVNMLNLLVSSYFADRGRKHIAASILDDANETKEGFLEMMASTPGQATS